MQFGKQNQWSTWWYGTPALFVLLILCVLLAVSVYERYSVEREMAHRKDASISELQQLESREYELKKRVEYMAGARGVEEEIRKNFDVARAGEQVVILTGTPPTTAATTSPEIITYPWYQFWR